MNFYQTIQLEFFKTKRSKAILVLFIAPILLVYSGVSSLSRFFTPEYPYPWHAMFIQSALLYAYYLLPFSMIVIATMLSARELQHGGQIKMLALPISPAKVSLAKFCVLVFYLFLEIAVFFLAFVITGVLTLQSSGLDEAVPVAFLLKWSSLLFFSMLPALAGIWLVTLRFEKPLLSVGINFLLTFPALLVGATPLWYFYPFSYSGHLVTSALHQFSNETSTVEFSWILFSLCAVTIFAILITLSAKVFARKIR